MSGDKAPSTYIRRRAYNKVHVRSWLIYLEKDGFVRCSFKNCDFMAFDVEEMCSHYGFCKGESSHAKHVCPVCGGRTNTETKLQFHMAKAHNYAMPESINESHEPAMVGDSSSKPSRVLVASWGCFFEANNYIKCTNCSYLANTLQDMQRHYNNCKKEIDQLLYVCPECKGRSATINPLLWHMERSHKILKSPNEFNHITQSMLRYWQQELEERGQACCLHARGVERDCFFFDVDLLSIIEHAQTCKGPKYLTVKVQCPDCKKWTNTVQKLSHHTKVEHSARKIAQPVRLSENQPNNKRFENVISEMNYSVAIKKDTKEEDSWLIAIDDENDFSSRNAANVNLEIRTSTISNDNCKYVTQLGKSNGIETIQKQHDTTVAAAIEMDFSQEEEEDQVMVIDLESESSRSREVQEVINVDEENTENSDEYLRTQQTEEILKKEDTTPVGYEVSYIPNCSDDVVVEIHSEGDPQESHVTCCEERIIISLEENRNEEQEEEVSIVPQENEEEILMSNVKGVCSISKSNTEELKVKSQKEITGAVHLNLFRDSASSDEDDVVVVKEKLKRHKCDDEDTEPPEEGYEQTEENCKKTSLKHYSKRLKHNSDSSSLSPVECPSTSPVEDVYLEAKYYLEDPDPTTTVNFSISEDGKILRDDQNKNKLLNGSIKLIQPVYSKPVPKISTMKRNENAEEISKSSEKNDKLMHLVVTEDLSGGQLLSTSTYCGKGSRKKTKFENGSIEVVDVQYNLVKTKDGSAVVENNCNMILHIDENSLSGENSEESCFVVAVEGNITHNFKNEKWQAEKCSKELNKSIVMFDDVELNKTHNPDIQDFNSVDCSNLKNSTHKELVVNGMGNDHELNTVIKKHEHTSGVQGLFEEVECLKPSVNKDMKSDIICDVKATSIKETIVKVEKPSKSDNISIIKIDKPKDCSSNTNNSTASNIVEGVIIPDSPNHSKTFSKIVTCPDIKSVDNQNNSKSTVNTHYKNNILITKECRPDRNEASSLVKELAKVSFLYQGKLVRRSSESSSSVMDESTDDVKEYDVDTIRTESNANSTQSLKQSEPRETNNSNLSNNIGNSSSKMNTAHDHLVVNDKIVISKTNNNVISDEESGKGTSDVSRRSSSDFLNDSSEDGEDFLGTDEEIDMKDQLFIGFNEVTEKLQSRRRSFHQFLNRLSESESEEWYISAGNLSMNFQKVERISSDKLLSKHHVHHNGETDKTKTANKTTTNFSSNKLERKLNCELNYCMVDQDNATSTHKIQSHLNNRSLKNSNLSVSHNSSNKKVSSEIMLYNKEKNLTREKVNKQSNNIECIKTELNSEGNNNQSLLNEKHQLGSETKEHMEEKSKSGSKYEIVNSQLKERKSPQKHNFLRIRNNCDNTNQNKKHIDKNCSPLSGLIMNNISERSNLDRSELSASLLLNNTNSSEPSHVTTEVPKNGDNSVWKCQSDGSDNRSKIKDHFDAREDQSCNRSSDQNPNHNLNHSLKNNTNCSIGSNIVNHLKKESNTQTIEPKANDEKVQDEIQRIPFPSTPEMELSNSEIKLSQEVLVKEDKSKTGKDSQLFLVKNYVRSKKEISVTAINASERDKINNIVSSTPKKRGRKPKIQDVFEECSVLESGKSVLENPSFEENKSPYFENMKTKISTEKNKNESVTGGTNEEDSSALETIKFLFKGQGSEENKPLLSKGGKVEAGIKSSHEENVNDENCMDGNAINKENIRNVSVSPKKRGRPPKAKNHIVEHSFAGANDNSMHENLMVVEEPHPLPKKRGRKPKLKCEEGSLQETNLNPIYKNAINEEESLILPKRRGRKPKAKHFVEDVVAGKKPTGENSVHEELQKEVTCSDLEYSINIKRDCKFSKDTSEVCELNSVSSHKKRGRPPKNKFPNNINTSKQEENFITEGTNKESSILKKYNEEEMLLSIYSEEVDMLLRDGSLQRINVDEGETLNSNIQTINVLPNVVKRKRGRPPKSQTTCVPLEHLENLNESLNNTILESRDRESDVLLPKKRGRPPKKRLVPHEPMIPELEQVESLPLSDRFKITEKSDLKKRKRKAEGNLSDPGTELLDTDVIFINREKLTDSLHSKFEKRRGRPKKNSQKATDKSFTTNDFEEINSDSDTSEEIWHESEDTDFEDIPKKKKRKGKAFFKYIKQDDDEDNSDKEQTKERGIKKQTGNRKPSEEQIFFAKHSNNDMVVCGVCKKEMNYKTYKTHHSVFTHYALCWLEGEEKPVDMTDDKEVVNRLWYSKKKLGKTPFRCFNCNLPKLSAVGFQSHIRFCGKEHEMESLMATCQECGATMKPSSLRPHMYIKHSTKSKAGSVDSSSIIPKVKRAAASKADEVLQNSKDDHELEGQLEDNFEGQSQWRPNSPQLRQMQHFYIKPNKIIPKEETERWKTSLRETNVVTCRHPDCTFSAITTIAFRKHYFSCPFFPPKLVYKCRQCQFVSEEEVAVQEHLMQEHRELLQPSPSSSIESGSESDEGSDEERTKMQKYRYNLSLPFKFLQNGFIKYKCRSHPKRFFFSDALLWTNKMRCENLTSDVLFPEAVGTARALAVSQVSQYLPTTASSIKFRGSDGSWRSLNCFQATLVDGVPVMFTGGPVWACAWAAVPDTEDNQYLAVASHPDMNLTHEMSAVYSYPSVIQVWAVGRLVNCLPKPESDNEPQFLMGIAHSRGAVWGLQWCPSGCYQDNRLGLLAAACSDGSVVIYSIPRHQPSSQHKICEMEPVMELKLGCEMLSQCKCIEWHTVAPHSIIVGGFANGMVALWDLHTTSPLLRDGKVIYPFKVFEAHLSAVTAVSLSPTAETTRAHLMTSSLDRATKFWRLDDTTAPVNTLRKASVTDAVMPSTWMTSINAFDDVYSTNSTHIMGYSYRETFTSNNTNFYPQLGTVWGVSFNEWINAIACGSEMGKLTVLFRRQLLVTEDSKKVKSNSMRDDLIMCSVQPLSDVKGNVEIGERYQDCVNNVGLDISFKGNAGAVKKPTEASVDTMENYPILSINKVTWNTNYNSFTWLAAGLQCGLVMAPHVTCLQANDLSELYQQHDGR